MLGPSFDAMVRFQIRKKLSPLTSRFSCLMNCCTPLCMQGLSRFHPLFDLESMEPKKGIVWCCMVGKVNSKSKHWSYMFTKSVIIKCSNPESTRFGFGFQKSREPFLERKCFGYLCPICQNVFGLLGRLPCARWESLYSEIGADKNLCPFGTTWWVWRNGQSTLFSTIAVLTLVATVLVFGRLSTSNLAWCF